MKTCQLPCNCYSLTDCTNFLRLGSFTLIFCYLGHRKRKKRHNTVWWYICIYHCKQTWKQAYASNQLQTRQILPLSTAILKSGPHDLEQVSGIRLLPRSSRSIDLWQLSTADRKYVTVSWKTTNSARHQLKAFPFLKGGDRLIGNDGDACVWILRSAVPLALQPLHKIVLETRTVQNFRVNTVAHPSISSREPWEIYKRVVRWTQRPVTWSMAPCRSGLRRLYMYGYFCAVSLVFVGYLVSLTGQSSLFVLKSSSLSKIVDSTTNSIEF